jgi:hypothetical protein
MKKIYNKKNNSLLYLAVTSIVMLPSLVSAQGWNVYSLNFSGLPNSSITGIIERFLLWTLGIFGTLGVIGFVISGIMYLTSAGDDDRMKIAKQAMQYSIIGIIVGLSGLIVVYAVDALLTGIGQI